MTDLKGLLSDWPVGAAGVAVVTPEGVGEIATIGADASTVFPWASVTKIVSALTVLDAWADGTIDLDSPAGPPGATVRHLLAHTSGLPFDGPEPVATVGTKRIYSNTGFDVLATHLAEQAGGPFTDELNGRVLEPLGMVSSSCSGSAAKDGSGSLADLVQLAQELLAPTVLGAEIVGLASTLAFPGLSGILPGFGRQPHNDWGLGCEIRNGKSPHWTSPANSPATFGHFGQSGSFVWVDPLARLACVSLADTPFGPWAAGVWPVLSTAVLDAYGS